MERIIINYKMNTDNQPRRLVIEKNLPLSREVVYAVLCLHKAGLIKLDNVLNVKEYLCA